MAQWKPVIGYETLYEVSDVGEVRRVAGYASSKNGSLRLVPAHVMRQARSRGYSVVNLCKNGLPRYVKVHRLVAAAFLPADETRQFVNHKDGNKQNNHVSNLEYVTTAENNRHAYEVCGKLERMLAGIARRRALPQSA